MENTGTAGGGDVMLQLRIGGFKRGKGPALEGNTSGHNKQSHGGWQQAGKFHLSEGYELPLVCQ